MAKNMYSPINEVKFPKQTPAGRVVEYFNSHAFRVPTQSSNIFREPEAFQIEVSKWRLALAFANNQLDMTRARHKKETHICDIKWRELERRQKEFRQTIVSQYNEFVSINEEKQKRGKQKIHDERRLFEQRNRAIKSLESKMNILNIIKTTREDQIKNMRIYDLFLNQTMEVLGPHYRNTQDILNRYDLLNDVRRELLGYQTNQQQIIHDKRKNLLEMLEKKRAILIDLIRRKTDIECRYKTYQERAQQSDTVLSHVKEHYTVFVRNFICIEKCCNNLYEQICARSGWECNLDLPLIKKLIFIKETIYYLQIVSKRPAAKGTVTYKIKNVQYSNKVNK